MCIITHDFMLSSIISISLAQATASLAELSRYVSLVQLKLAAPRAAIQPATCKSRKVSLSSIKCKPRVPSTMKIEQFCPNCRLSKSVPPFYFITIKLKSNFNSTLASELGHTAPHLATVNMHSSSSFKHDLNHASYLLHLTVIHSSV